MIQREICARLAAFGEGLVPGGGDADGWVLDAGCGTGFGVESLRRLRPGGHLTLVQLAERLPDVLAALGPGFGSVVVLPVVPRADRPATRILLRARKGGRGAFRLLSPLVLHEGPAHDGDRESFRPEVSAVLRDGAALAAFG